MKREQFKNSPSGRLVPTIQNCWAFVPNPLPPDNVDFGSLTPQLTRAATKLGQLDGMVDTLPDPAILNQAFARREALTSSRMEGTVTSMAELVRADVDPEAADLSVETREVQNYNRALSHGLKRLKDLPVSSRLLKELHGILLGGLPVHRGGRFVPGELKTQQNWIDGRTIETARYVPPPPVEATDCLSAMESFVNSPDRYGFLIRAALSHYQFEAIHPFPDGNGRVGRLMLPLLAAQDSATAHPVLFLSPYFERHKDRYVDLMFEVSSDGAWLAWVEFFLKAVEASAEESLRRAKRLIALRKHYLEVVTRSRSSVLQTKIVEFLFSAPAMTVKQAQNLLGVTYNAAKVHINNMVKAGILEPGPERRPQWYYAWGIIAELNDDQSQVGGK